MEFVQQVEASVRVSGAVPQAGAGVCTAIPRVCHEQQGRCSPACSHKPRPSQSGQGIQQRCIDAEQRGLNRARPHWRAGARLRAAIVSDGAWCSPPVNAVCSKNMNVLGDWDRDCDRDWDWDCEEVDVVGTTAW
jgi:hypothetical protein